MNQYSDLKQAINNLMTGGQSYVLMEQAQHYCESFLSHYQNNLPGLLTLFEDQQFSSIMNDMEKFWLLQSICDIVKVQERYQQGVASTPQLRQTLYAQYFRLLQTYPSQFLQTKYFFSKYALIFVLIVKWDFPHAYPNAFTDLLSLPQSTQDLEVQKKYVQFIIQVMLMLDEELIERYDEKDKQHNYLANNVKDGIRAGPISDICNLIISILQNFALFDQDIVNDSLQVSSQLIDWNALDHFNQIVLLAKQMLASQSDEQFKPFRTNAFKVIHAVVDKGMDYPMKIEILVNLEYCSLLESFPIIYRERNILNYQDEQDEEESFLHEVAFSVDKIGQWCLELFMHHDKILQDPQHQQHYENIMTRLLQISLNLLNTERPRIGRHIVEFFSFWLQAIKKMDSLNEFFGQVLVQLTQIAVQRLAYPKWFQFGGGYNEEDYTDYEEDFAKYREELVTNIIANLGLITPFKETYLKIIADLLQNLNPQTQTFAQAEVILYLLYHLQQSIPSNLRDKATPDNIYCQLLQYALQVDFLGGFNHKAVNLIYLEVMVRYNQYFFPVAGFANRITEVFFSDKALMSKTPKLAQKSSFLLLRLCERLVNYLQIEEAQQCVPVILKNVSAIIGMILSGQLYGGLRLGYEEALTLYNVMSILVTNQHVDNELRVKYLQSVYEDLYKKLKDSFTNGQLDSVVWCMKFINTFSKGLHYKNQISEVLGQFIEQILQLAITVMGNHLKQREICDQVLQYLMKCITLIGSNTLEMINQIGFAFLQQVEFERFESIFNILCFTAQSLGTEAAPMTKQLFNAFFERVASVPLPQSTISDIDKNIMSVHSSYLRFVHSCLEYVELKNLVPFPERLTPWLLDFFNRVNERALKKTIAQIFKELLMQVTNFKYQTQYREAIAQIVNQSKKNLDKEVSNQLAYGMVVNLQSLPSSMQAIIEQALILATQGLFKCNPIVLDDMHIIKVLTEIQVIYVILNFREHLEQALISVGQQNGIPNASLLVQVIDQFLTVAQPQTRSLHDTYIKTYKQLLQQKSTTPLFQQ